MAHRALAIIRRRLFACLTILSLLLCLATVALWVRSYWRYDFLSNLSRNGEIVQSFGARSNFGELGLATVHYAAGSVNRAQGWDYQTTPASADQTFRHYAKVALPDAWFSVLGFGFHTDQRTLPGYFSRRDIWFPHWFCALIFAVLPALRLRSILRTRRQNRVGLCFYCGYDLRATPPDGKCPECGQARSPTALTPSPSPSAEKRYLA